ncbi:MAG TPA: polyribonucleotide nucleotidyltransferase [Candidatus Hydrogenedentes bacterium]|jgi:polyribonucleotide nucleotidyltransferase|nr:MAG: Polyribonucleotide nucleotidyltransferase [Candidatus Hydrogenedentes bacterium ADurb.Bin170]HNZ47405.1 polyribonucleotide nucleotidyltransferase [Candidatus Hydrogenedentota bacterium]HOD94205.1 polyribonucleotide nucleotidyltransferase [Candidatus Hydrogenedentota bacterium]HOR49612.1 polyribonucleotide nucleotidyltransferase [Candidatus Hydrogenedentota bacterium]HPK23585.1 polyribonucleotide nucleotidyltransferase [Candidatus Hydrogenedentota bacterium]
MLKTASVDVGTEKMTFETGRVAKQAHGAVICRSGDTMVLSAVTVAPDMRDGQDFFPLTVDYREKFYAVGQIPGNFFRRESRPSEREILVCRMTDRPLRPLFPKNFLNEVMVCQTVLSADNVNNPDVLSINAASAALHISKIPLLEPVGAVRVGCLDGVLTANPAMEEMKKSTLDIVVAGTRDSICMVEGQANEVSELFMVEALEFAHGHIRNIIAAIDALREAAGVEKMPVPEDEQPPELVAEIETLAAKRLGDALAIKEKQVRLDTIDALKSEIEATLLEKYGEEWGATFGAAAGEIFNDLKKRIMRQAVIDTNIRMDGRRLDEIRQITIELDILPRAHGSVLFTRGETQALVVTTLGTSRDEMRLDELTGDEFRRFFLHYNFPAWSVGEVRRISGPGRREVGHGKLAERALEPMLPFLQEKDEETVQENEIHFPYTVRIVSDITESNGSSSMATVCGGSLSMMAAGVPVTNSVAGIAMGMIKEGNEVRILSDILGDEDHLGDMDFKVCGTSKGITAFQMDTKIKGLSREVMEQALEQARAGRAHILSIMESALAAPREDMSPYAPRIFTITIHPDKIREVIGPGGKVIRQIQAETGAEIEIEDDGTVNIAATNKEDADAAIDFIREIVAEVEVGKIYHGRVTRIMNFGAFCTVIGSKEGLVHISELADYRVHNVTDVVNVGDEIDVKVLEIDSMGRVNLSKIAADRELDQVQPAPEGYFEQRGGGEQRDNRGGRGGGDRRDRNDGGRRGGPSRGRRNDRSDRD